MANKAKSQKSKEENTKPDTLKQEKEVDIEVKKLLKDERTHKIAGSICLLMALLFFIAFTSYLFTWDEDQDKVFQHGYKLLLGADTKVANLMGTFGAYISHFFIYKGFGITSYLICSLFFVAGVNLFFGKKVFSIVRNLKYLVIGLPVLSVTASVIMNGNAFAWGGSVGDMIKDWLFVTVGKIGTIGIIAVAFLAYVIWRFNPAFKIPSVKKEAAAGSEAESFAREEWPDEEADEVRASIKGNSMKGNAAMADKNIQQPEAKHDLELVEKEEPVSKKNNVLKQEEPVEEIVAEEAEEVIVEAFMEGTELTCGCYKTKEKSVIFPPTEVVTHNEFFDYDAKYNGQVDEITPARISPELTGRVQKLTSAIYDILGCSGIIRVDYIVTAGEKLNLLEVNTTPGMTATSFIPQQVRAAGLDIKDVMTDIIENKF